MRMMMLKSSRDQTSTRSACSRNSDVRSCCCSCGLRTWIQPLAAWLCAVRWSNTARNPRLLIRPGTATLTPNLAPGRRRAGFEERFPMVVGVVGEMFEERECLRGACDVVEEWWWCRKSSERSCCCGQSLRKSFTSANHWTKIVVGGSQLDVSFCESSRRHSDQFGTTRKRLRFVKGRAGHEKCCRRGSKNSHKTPDSTQMPSQKPETQTVLSTGQPEPPTPDSRREKDRAGSPERTQTPETRWAGGARDCREGKAPLVTVAQLRPRLAQQKPATLLEEDVAGEGVDEAGGDERVLEV
ncbi:hypothetical protein HDK64DRAFT_269321 [Phyllosticta capitalensis]